jgi:phytoene synthase
MRPDRAFEADVEDCGRILRAGSRSFAMASTLLPARIRAPATVLYAFCRIFDDRIDEVPGATEDAIAELRARLDDVYAGRPLDVPADRALARVVERQQIPRELPLALLEGLAWDASGRRYERLDDVLAYAARVAGTVGAMMTLVMGQRGRQALARACDLGVAMQLTNIARDVGEDARRGRIYLPLAWMREGGIDPVAWLAAPVCGEALTQVIARLLVEADLLYRRADLGIALLPADCRAAIRTARLIYSDIGRVIGEAGYDSVSQRARVSGLRKLWLLARATAARSERARGADLPPLESTRFLVEACASGTSK